VADEPPLQMTLAQLAAVRDAALAVKDRPGVHVYDDFIIYAGACRWGLSRLVARALWGRVRGR
jgi:hydroxyacylglutathione hydrolase